MADSESLRNLFARIDGAAPSIQQAAAAMMRHYDRSTATAVNEWRSALMGAAPHQLLPLLYVINEVVQTSKRNRGTKFLEALGPVLKQAFVHVCRTANDPNQTEKVRRLVKIWGDRHVFSIRFVNDLLQAMEPFRAGRQRPPPSIEEAASFSPQSSSPQVEHTPDKTDEDDDEDDIQQILDDRETNQDASSQDDNSEDNSDDDDFDDDNVFQEPSSSQKLQLDINLDSASSALLQQQQPKSKRGRRDSTGSTNNTKRRRVSVLSPNNLVEVWSKLVELEQSMELAQHVLSSMDQRLKKTPSESLEGLVGDELQQAYTQNEMEIRNMMQERANLHSIARNRKALEQDAVRYLIWLEKGLQQDTEDLEFCNILEQKLQSFQPVHTVIVKARDERLEQDRKRKLLEQEEARKRKEEEEAERFRQAAFSRETEAKPGMVWNPRTQEYQTLHTDESWRD